VLLGNWNLVIATSYEFLVSSNTLVLSFPRTPWKMMDFPRDCVAKKGMLEHGG
jgi:hypothetical protein